MIKSTTKDGPCKTCNTNYKAYRTKVHDLESKNSKLESKIDSLEAKYLASLEENKRKSEEIHLLKEKLIEAQWKLSLFQQQPAQHTNFGIQHPSQPPKPMYFLERTTNRGAWPD